MRRPTLDEANTLVAHLESCEAGLGRTVRGPTTPKKTRVAPQAAVLHRGNHHGGDGSAALGARSAKLPGGVWAQRSAGGKAHPQG